METVELQTLLRYRMETPSGMHQDVSEYLLNGTAEIIGRTFDCANEISLGYLEFTLIRVSLACEDAANLFTLFDQTQEISDLAGALYDFDYEEYTEAVRTTFSETFGHEDILYVRDIGVLPFARGQRLGLSALHRVAKDWDGGCGLIAIDPFPMQCRENAGDEAEWRRLALGVFPSDLKSARERLSHHFRGLGFQNIGSSRYLLRSSKLRQIPVEELDVRNSVFIPKAILDAVNDGRA